MDITYAPEDGDRREWQFNPKRVKVSKAEMIEKRYGQNWEQWLIDLQSGNIKARRVLLWHLYTLDHPAMRYEDTPDFYADELTVEHNTAELAEIRERVMKAQIDDAKREDVLAALDTEITEAMEREQARGGSEGKAPSKTSKSGTA